MIFKAVSSEKSSKMRDALCDSKKETELINRAAFQAKFPPNREWRLLTVLFAYLFKYDQGFWYFVTILGIYSVNFHQRSSKPVVTKRNRRPLRLKRNNATWRRTRIHGRPDVALITLWGCGGNEILSRCLSSVLFPWLQRRVANSTVGREGGQATEWMKSTKAAEVLCSQGRGKNGRQVCGGSGRRFQTSNAALGSHPVRFLCFRHGAG